MQKIINIDSQILSSIQSCEKKTELHFIRHIQPEHKAPALEKGELIHIPLEIYYALMGSCVNLDSLVWQDLLETKLSTIEELTELQKVGAKDRRTRIIDLAIQFARYRATKMTVDVDECEEVIYQFGEYCAFYTNEPVIPLAVEEVGSRILFEDQDVKIVYTFKIDLVCEIDGRSYPIDHKSSSRRQDPSSMSNQFIGYCYGLDVNHIIINTIGFQKSLKPKERFQRVILNVDDERIEEWRRNAVFHIKRWIKTMETGFFPMRYTACKGNFVCQYIGLCEQAPSGREWIIGRDFKIGAQWDPSLTLIGKDEQKAT